MIVVAVLGLIVPGYALAPALLLPAATIAAFPFPALILAETVIAFSLAGLPLRFSSVLGAVGLISLAPLAILAWRAGKPAAVEVDGGSAGAREIPAFQALGVGLALVVLAGM